MRNIILTVVDCDNNVLYTKESKTCDSPTCLLKNAEGFAEQLENYYNDYEDPKGFPKNFGWGIDRPHKVIARFSDDPDNQIVAVCCIDALDHCVTEETIKECVAKNTVYLNYAS